MQPLSSLFAPADVLDLFDPQAQESNRLGKLTPQQAAWLKDAAQGSGTGRIFTLLFAAGFMLLIWLCILLPMLFAVLQNSILFFVILLFTGVAIAGFIIPTIQPIRAWQALRTDAASPTLRSEQGRLSYDKKGYRLNGLILTPNLSHPMDVSVPYQVYYLENSHIIVSAQPLGQPSTSGESAALTEILLSANGLSAEDLETCRQGELSLVMRLKVLPQVLIGLIFAGFPLVIVIPVMQGLLNHPPAYTDLPGSLLRAGVPLLLGVIFAGLGGTLFFQGLADLLSSAPEQLQGPGHKETRLSSGKNRRRQYFYVVEGISFQVAPQAYQALIDGKRYRVYYLQRTKKLLALEAV